MLLVVCLCAAQIAARAQQADTVFLVPPASPGSDHSVFIVPERGRAEMYRRLADFSLTADDSAALRDAGLLVRADRMPAKRKAALAPLRGLPGAWLPLCYHAGQYYLYDPCDEGANRKMQLRPGLLLVWFMDGPSPDLVMSGACLSPDTYRLNTAADAAGNGAMQRLIHLVPSMPGVAVWEDPQAAPDERYRLYVSRDAAKNYPIITNRCTEMKADEYEFETPPFAELLSRKKQN